MRTADTALVTFGFRIDPVIGVHEHDEDTEQDPDFASTSRNNDWFGYGWLVPRNAGSGKGEFNKQTQFKYFIRKIWTAYKRHIEYVGKFALSRPSTNSERGWGWPVVVLEADLFVLKIIEVLFVPDDTKNWFTNLNKYGKGYVKVSFINLFGNQQTNCHTFCDGMFSSHTKMRWFEEDAQGGYWAKSLKQATSYVDVMKLCAEYMYVGSCLVHGLICVRLCIKTGARLCSPCFAASPTCSECGWMRDGCLPATFLTELSY